jgi:hypothetical protein
MDQAEQSQPGARYDKGAGGQKIPANTVKEFVHANTSNHGALCQAADDSPVRDKSGHLPSKFAIELLTLMHNP